MVKQESLFVCGSFCKGMVNFSRIENFVKQSIPAFVKATVCRLPVGYPSLLHTSKAPVRVAGQLLSLSGPEVLFALLDEFHGYNSQHPEKSLHWRQSVEVESKEGVVVGAQAYFMNPNKAPKGYMVIEDGNWEASIEELEPLPQRLTEKQATYIRKLGSTKGRDIVPIDLELYRQLMSLELIVDKGRRLALTKLGKEVHRYLGL